MSDARIKIPVETEAETETEGKASTAVGVTAEAAAARDTADEWMPLMLVATLVAVVTFRSALRPPMGFWPDTRDGHLAGNSVFRSTYPDSFRYFALCNGVGFFTSVGMLLCLAYDRLHNTPTKMAALAIVAAVDLGMLLCAFLFGTFPEQPSDGLWCILYALAICGTLFLAVYLTRSPWRDAEKLRKRGKSTKRRI